jgi:hypothetical protein
MKTNLFASTFYLISSTGQIVFPVRIRNVDTGRVSYRLSRSGNTKADMLEIDDEAELLRLCLTGQWMVRVAAKKPGSPRNYVWPLLNHRIVTM